MTMGLTAVPVPHIRAGMQEDSKRRAPKSGMSQALREDTYSSINLATSGGWAKHAMEFDELSPGMKTFNRFFDILGCE